MKRNRFLLTATILAALVALSFSMMQGGTLAKFAASAIGWGKAQVALWNIGEQRGPADDDGEPVLIIFETDTTTAERTATLLLVNNSEVTACYTLQASVSYVDALFGETAFLAAIKTSIDANTNYNPTTGVVLSPGSQTTLDITIPAVSFRGLEIAANAVQVD